MDHVLHAAIAVYSVLYFSVSFHQCNAFVSILWLGALCKNVYMRGRCMVLPVQTAVYLYIVYYSSLGAVSAGKYILHECNL